MGRTKTANRKKLKISVDENKRPREKEADSKVRQKNFRQLAKLANESKLKAKLTEKLQSSGMSLDGLELVTIPNDGYMDIPGPSTSRDPLNLSLISRATSAEENDEFEDEESSSEQNTSDQGETTAGEASASETSASETTAGETTAGETTAGGTSAGRTSSGRTSAGGTSAGGTSAGETSAGADRAGGASGGESTAGDEELDFPMPIKATPSSMIAFNEGTETLVDHWRKKFVKQLEKSKQLSHELLLEKSKTSRLNQLVVTQMAMIRELRMGKETSVFTAEAGIGITVTELEDISSQSKHTADFAQRLALFFYGADELRKRKVTTKGDPRLTPIDPKLLKFIHNKARQRVAKLEGLDAYEKIAIEADPATINKALAEKIQNLRKARILQAARGNAFNQ